MNSDSKFLFQQMNTQSLIYKLSALSFFVIVMSSTNFVKASQKKKKKRLNKN